MYEAYFGLQKRPFAATPDTGCLYAPDQVQEILGELTLRVERPQGIGVLSGAPGTGKTLLCRRLASELADRFTTVCLANSTYPTRRALLQAVLFELGGKYSKLDDQELRFELAGALTSAVQGGRPVVLILDEAHLLGERLLDEVRMMDNLALDGQPLVRIVLAAQPSLEERLAEPALESLNQRIGCHVSLEPLTSRESIDYIDFRINWAGGSTTRLFEPEALGAIARAANGLPRCLNQLCDHALLLAFVQEQPHVTVEIVNDALGDLRQLPLQWNEALTAELASNEREAGFMSHDTQPFVAESDSPSTAAACVEFGTDDDLDFRTSDVELTEDAPERMELPSTSEHLQAAAAARASGGEAVVRAEEGTGSVPSSVRIFQEEPVEDGYAAIDARTSRGSRTFEDAYLPDAFRPAEGVQIPPAPQPSAVPAPQAPRNREDQGWGGTPLEVLLPEIDASLEAHSQIAGSQRTDKDSGLTDELEDQIGSSVLDVCLDVQNAMGGLWDDGDLTGEVDVPSESGCPGSADPANGMYDAVEPQPARAPAARPDALNTRAIQTDAPYGSAGRTAPPSYKRVFSALRRRSGQSAWSPSGRTSGP